MGKSLFIPRTINVGYQNRNDTYTKKLAYIIYYDEKGKLRKEVSWNNWRDQNIPNNVFDNEPTSGFVLNKKVGDYKYGWDSRKAYCRVYDPRGFEFEITIDNLLFILEYCNCIKGKGLEGEFVYAWSSKDLVLLPIDSPDYTNSKDAVTSKKLGMKDMVVGATYETTEDIEIIYLGKHDLYEYHYKFKDKEEKIAVARNYVDIPYTSSYTKVEYISIPVYKGKALWFAHTTKNGRVFLEHYKSVPKRILKCKEKSTSCYLEECLEALKNDKNYSPVLMEKTEVEEVSKEKFKDYFNNQYSNRVYSESGFTYTVLRLNLDNQNEQPKYAIVPAYKEENYLRYGRGDGIDTGIHPDEHKLEAERLLGTDISDIEYYSIHHYKGKKQYTLDEVYDILKPIGLRFMQANGNCYRKSEILGE